MTARSWTLAGAAIVLLAGIVACKTTQAPAPTSAGQVSAGTPTTSSGGGGGTSIPTLVNVNLQDVLNDLSVSLNINRDNIPVTAQVPINVAASVCGVSVDALAASIANGQASCTATTTTPALTQAVQQQIASGGSVTGGPQTMGGATTNNMM
jgi:ABC-type proline/glycine betaine transport system substrate-binding protein